MPLVNERQLIASSTREMKLWRELYGNELSDLHIISEKQFIRHTMYLISKLFDYNILHIIINIIKI